MFWQADIDPTIVHQNESMLEFCCSELEETAYCFTVALMYSVEGGIEEEVYVFSPYFSPVIDKTSDSNM